MVTVEQRHNRSLRVVESRSPSVTRAVGILDELARRQGAVSSCPPATGDRTESGVVQRLLAPRGDRRYAVPSRRGPAVDDVWTGFVRTLEPVEFRAGQVILRLGVRTDDLHVISSGRAKTCRTSAEGRKLVLDFHGPRDVLAEPTLFDADEGQACDTTVAITDVRAGRISRAALLQWIVMCPEVAEHLLGVLARAQDETHQRWLDMMRIDTPGRLAKALLRLARRFHTGAPGRSRSSRASPSTNWPSTSVPVGTR